MQYDSSGALGLHSAEHAPSGEVHVSLCCDALCCIFSHLDAFALGRVACVSTPWRAAAYQDHLWGGLVRARWKLRDKTGRYKYGERSWREVYRVFNRRMRIPAIEDVGQLSPRPML
jgi:hypothetical protein